MVKQLVTILILINIFGGYFAEAYQGEISNCSSVVSQQSNHGPQDDQSSEPKNSDHSDDKQCLGSHCLFGQCAAIKQIYFIKPYLGKTTLSEFNSSLSAIDFIFNLLRPPIAA